MDKLEIVSLGIFADYFRDYFCNETKWKFIAFRIVTSNYNTIEL